MNSKNLTLTRDRENRWQLYICTPCAKLLHTIAVTIYSKNEDFTVLPLTDCDNRNPLVWTSRLIFPVVFSGCTRLTLKYIRICSLFKTKTCRDGWLYRSLFKTKLNINVMSSVKRLLMEEQNSVISYISCFHTFVIVFMVNTPQRVTKNVFCRCSWATNMVGLDQTLRIMCCVWSRPTIMCPSTRHLFADDATSCN